MDTLLNLRERFVGLPPTVTKGPASDGYKHTIGVSEGGVVVAASEDSLHVDVAC